ncbi:MAG: ABC-2 type transport system permease protein [Candidatus Peregrinibacteria bacterium Greene0416_62]|nr:MAG: ABC-2 type transport system permease protein [Candidatus Peregrinibacteria bacterium Greene0416_62]
MHHYTARQMLRIVWIVGWSDFFLKYRGSILGYVWSLLAPLAKFLVIYYVFRPFVSDTIPYYSLYLFLGIIVWEHFTVTTTHCMTVLHEKAAFVQKLPFPRILLMFIVGWTNLIIFLTHLLIFVLFVLVTGKGFSGHWIYVPLILFQMTILAVGIGMILSAYCLKYRDIPHLWGVATQVLFWLTPITYAYKLDAPLLQTLRRLPEMIQGTALHNVFSVFVQFQPLSLLMYDLRRVTLYPRELGTPSMEHLIGMTLVFGAIFYVGVVIFQKRCRHFVQEY